MELFSIKIRCTFQLVSTTYYRSADIRAFVQENADSKTYERFKKENQLDKQTEAK